MKPAHSITVLAARLAFLAAAVLPVAGHASPALSPIETFCGAGADIKKVGDADEPSDVMPRSIPGVLTVSPGEAKCLMTKLGSELRSRDEDKGEGAI